MDHLEVDINNIAFDASTILHLPLSTIWTSVTGHDPHKEVYKKLLVKNMFHFYPSTGTFHFRSWQFNAPNRTNHVPSSKSFATSFVHNQLVSRPFFQQLFSTSLPSTATTYTPTYINATAITTHMDFIYIKQPWKTRVYRQLCIPPQLVITSITRLSWKRFWKSHIEHCCSQCLDSSYSQHNDFTTCRLCQQAPETLDYFLVLCPSRLPIWLEMWNTHFESSAFDPDTILHIIKQLQLPASSSKIIIIVSCYLWAL